MHTVRSPDGLRAGFGQANVADEAGAHHLGHHSDRFLDGHRGIDASEAVDIHPVCSAHRGSAARCGPCRSSRRYRATSRRHRGPHESSPCSPPRRRDHTGRTCPCNLIRCPRPTGHVVRVLSCRLLPLRQLERVHRTTAADEHRRPDSRHAKNWSTPLTGLPSTDRKAILPYPAERARRPACCTPWARHVTSGQCLTRHSTP
jgi:hypothetical protein